MDSQTPDLVFAYEGTPYTDEICSEFRDLVSAGGLNLRFEQMPSTRGWGGVEGVLPTAFMVWIAKPYFDGFLGEMGKDHYIALKAGVRAVARLAHFNVTKIGTPGKVAPVQPYSLIFYVWFHRDDETRFKFLIPIDLTEDEPKRLGTTTSPSSMAGAPAQWRRLTALPTRFLARWVALFCWRIHRRQRESKWSIPLLDS